jgi:hypothetical protein
MSSTKQIQKYTYASILSAKRPCYDNGAIYQKRLDVSDAE